MISAEDCRSYMLCTNNTDEDFEATDRKGIKLEDTTPKKKEEEVDPLQDVINLFGG